MGAQFRLDEHELLDERLNAIVDHTSRLLSLWAGRTPPINAPAVPAWVAEAAVEWRQERDRRERGRRAA
ncbi:hypothetical protein [Mesorhizobium sp. ES1-3]|uniref:hypothetical protein n=1 Tax=Mesorhizobium sp. ES1-3 TaxID=2876628 RepID=UPI001CCF93E2|nr:hypothetical protein [Mesorhizobium sp. ES1-3]MBZ9673439.1 hypothetical protein [Mesorhizobium sp. ES1-3]